MSWVLVTGMFKERHIRMLHGWVAGFEPKVVLEMTD
jgi:hypothetical protein